MFIDLIFPSDNEKSFIDMAVELGIKGLCFVYKGKPKPIKPLQEGVSGRIKLFSASLKDRKSHLVIADALKQKDIRPVIERKKADIIFNLEAVGRKDFMHHRNSGLNQVLCKLMHEKKIVLGISFDTMLNAADAKRAAFLGRIKQNITFCRKYKVDIALASFASVPEHMRAYHDLVSLGVFLGFNEKEAKHALDNTHRKVLYNIKKKSPDYISDDITRVR